MNDYKYIRNNFQSIFVCVILYQPCFEHISTRQNDNLRKLLELN